MRRAAPALFLALAISASAAQDGPARRVLVALESSSALSAQECADDLAAAISRSPCALEVRRASGGSDPIEEAGRLSFDLAVYACLLNSDKGVYMWWRVYSAASGEELGGGSSDSGPPSARELLDAFWLDVVASLESAAARLPVAGGARLVVVGPPGATVKGLGADPIVLGPEGLAELVVPAPATYAWSASARGYDRAEGVLAALGREAEELRIEPPRQYRWNIDSGLYNGAFPDFWASRRLLDDTLFIRAGFRQYLAGLSLRDAHPGGDPGCLASLPLLEPGLGGGVLLGEPGRPLRAYAGVLATSRIAFPEGAGIFVDPVAPLCVEPFCALEWKPLDRWGFFGELYAGLYLFADERLFAASSGKSSDGPAPLFIYGDGWVFDIPNLRFGARFYL